MEIPYVIKRKVSWYLKNFPESKIIHLGQYNGGEAFYVQIPENSLTGFPPVFILRDRKAVEIMGEETLHIISQLLKE